MRVMMPEAVTVAMPVVMSMVVIMGMSLVGIVVGMRVGMVVRVGHGVLDVSMSGEGRAFSNRSPDGAASPALPPRARCVRDAAFCRGRPS